ncbi:hypothetical protein E1301_Tti013469 [Triplophysa tibetana]|uniref:Uncharacterized protein n=1 Tax=Triplophysa tibetana TaxID=1572043 RepID=A0A5A9NP24_9TELE|nr:hypothetical protein E1301_Tti013469 [Triplophysa tibetana]
MKNTLTLSIVLVLLCGLSSGAIAGIYAFLAVCAVCAFAGGVIFYLHMSEVKKLMSVTTHSTPSTHDAEKSFRDARSGTVPITKGTPFSVAVVVTYVVLLFLSLLVLLAIAVYQSHRKTSALRQKRESCTSKGDKGGICVVVFHCVVTVLLLLLVVLTGVVTFSYINNLGLKQMDDTSSTSLAVVFGVLQILLFLAVMKVFQRISQQKQREICLGVLCLLLLLVLIVVIYTFGFVDLKHVEGHMAKVYIVLLVLMVLGVIYHFSESFYLMMIKVRLTARDTESPSVTDTDSVANTPETQITTAFKDHLCQVGSLCVWTQFSGPALAAYCLLLFLFLLVLMAICVYQCRHNISGLRLIIDMSSTSLAVLLGVLLMLPFLAVIKVFQRISQQKQRGFSLRSNTEHLNKFTDHFDQLKHNMKTISLLFIISFFINASVYSTYTNKTQLTHCLNIFNPNSVQRGLLLRATIAAGIRLYPKRALLHLPAS